jgi:hypothetical protein
MKDERHLEAWYRLAVINVSAAEFYFVGYNAAQSAESTDVSEEHVASEESADFNVLHSVISHKTELSITTAVRTSNPTRLAGSVLYNINDYF